jgi:hypothetical protein
MGALQHYLHDPVAVIGTAVAIVLAWVLSFAGRKYSVGDRIEISKLTGDVLTGESARQNSHICGEPKRHRPGAEVTEQVSLGARPESRWLRVPRCCTTARMRSSPARPGCQLISADITYYQLADFFIP